MTKTAPLSFDDASFYDALMAAAFAALAEDMRKAQLVEWWNAGDVHGAAEAYVTDYARKYGFPVEIVETEESEDSTDEHCAIDVVFFMPGGRNEAYQRFTIWIEGTGKDAFLYGEW